MSTDVSGAITAVATAVLAVFAIVTAIYAIRAFRKQSKEVSEQAKMLKVQSDQLDEQRKINERQTEVLALQEADLRESLAERRREVARRPCAQASRVSLIAKVVWVTPKDFDSGFRLEVTVVNANDPQQPVYDVRLYWYCDGELYGRDSPEDLGTVLATATAFHLLARVTYQLIQSRAVALAHPQRGAIGEHYRKFAVWLRLQLGDTLCVYDCRTMNAREASWRQALLQS